MYYALPHLRLPDFASVLCPNYMSTFLGLTLVYHNVLNFLQDRGCEIFAKLRLKLYTWARMAATSERRPGLARSRAWWPLLQRTNSSGKWRYWSRSQLACSLCPSVRNALPVVTVTRPSQESDFPTMIRQLAAPDHAVLPGDGVRGDDGEPPHEPRPP